MSDTTSPARLLWQVVEPIHALTYFSPESAACFQAAGLRGFWRGYFAGRAAPLGPVPAPDVASAFFGFHPAFVARAIPGVWEAVTPSVAIDARVEGAAAAIDRLFTGAGERKAVAQATALLTDLLDGLDGADRPLYAANAALTWPDDPSARLWHATTLLREHRGDGHVLALRAAGFDPCESHLTQVASAHTSLEHIRPYRGWEDGDWAAARRRLRGRGLLDGRGRLTPLGAQLRASVEAETDRLASGPLDRIGPERAMQVIEAFAPLAERVVATGSIPYPNPIGVPRPPA